MLAFVSPKAWLLFSTMCATIGALSLALAGCGEPSSGSSQKEHASCSPGEIAVSDDVCVQAGVQGCAAEHIGEDGVCRPLPESCPPGTIPHFEKGCVPVGIEGCAPQLIGEDGLCRPTPGACPGGTIPRLDTGCAPVGIEGCDPMFLEDGRCRVRMAKCPAGTFASPQLGCVSIDGPAGCGVGTWGALADLPGTLYVDGSADPAGADGSQAKPFTTIAAALAEVPSGGRIALAAGQYAEPLHITKPVSIAGRCASMVSITGTQSGNDLPVIVWFEEAKGAALSGVRIHGDGVGVLLQFAKATIEDVHIDGASKYGIFAFGKSAEAVVRRTLVEDLADGPPGMPATAIVADGKSTVTLENSTIYHGLTVGMAGLAGTALSGKGVLVEATLGYGLGAEVQGNVSFEDSSFVSNRIVGLLADAPASVTLTRVVVEDTAIDQAADLGHGVEVEAGATVEMSSCIVSENDNVGIFVGGALTLRESLIEGNGKASPESTAAGMTVLGAASGTIEDSVFDRNTRVALQVAEGGQVNATRTLFASTASTKKGFGGTAVVTRNKGSKTVLSDCALTGNKFAGLITEDAAITELSRCLVEETTPDPSGQFGTGVAINGGSTLLLQRSVVARNHHLAIQANQGGLVRAEESWITGTRPSGDPVAGYGAQVTSSALEVVGSLFSDNRGHEIAAFGQGSRVSVQGSVFLGGPSAKETARGIFVDRGGQLQMTSTLVRATGAFAVFAQEAAVTLSDCTIERVVERDLAVAGQPLVGDGLLAVRAALDLHGLLISECPRAGLFLWDATGTVESALSTRNRFGVVLEGSAPALGSSAVFVANTDGDRYQGGDLPVPDAPSPLPSP